jgi:outer membrane receptor protein involved in Fe transport
MIGMYGRCAFPRKCLNAGQSCVTEPVIRGSCVMKAIAVAMAIGLIAFLASPWVVQAQSTSATISGTVTDETGAVVQGAHILLTNEATSTEQTTMSGSAGNFTIINIPPGTYSILVSKDGFNTIRQIDLTLLVNQTAALAFKLSIGKTQQTVSVSAAISTVDSSTAELGTVITSKSVTDLPLNGRNFTQLLTLTPGVSPISVAQNSGGGGGFAGEAIGNFTFPAVNGQRNRSNMFYMDGMNDLAFIGNYNYPPIIDAIQEFKVQSHNDLAEFGQVSGGIVNVVTKSGSNAFHGSAWEFLRNSALDARNYFLPTVNPLRQNQFGVTTGGPVWVPHLYRGKDKTFFFFAYEGFRQSEAAQSLVLVPTSAQLNGDFSALLAQGIQLYDPYSTRPDPANPGEYLRDAYPGNMITNLSPQALLYAKLFPPANPAVNVPGANLYDTTPIRTNYDSYSGRIDQAFGAHDFLFGRISYINEPVTSSGGYPGVFSSISIYGWNGVVHWSHVFGPTAILDFTFGRSIGNDTDRVSFASAPPDFAASLISAGFSSQYLSGFLAQPGNLIPIIGIAGYASSGSTGSNNTQSTQLSNTYQYGANFTKILSKHTLKFGGIFSTNNWIGPLAGASESTSAFQTSNLENPGGPSGKGTGDALASFLVGVPTSSQRRDANELEHDGWVDGGYIQDQFKITPRLTVNAGVRYDIAIWPVYGRLSDGSGYIGDLNLGNGTYLLTAVPPACSTTRGAPCIPGGTLPDNVVVTRNSNHSIHNTDTGNWQPRLGIAYQPVATTSIRTGYSRFYDEWSGVAETAQGAGGNWPSGGLLTIYSQNINVPTASITDPLNLGTGTIFYPAPTPFQNTSYYFNPSLKVPFTDQWNLGIDQEVGLNTTLSLVYAGSHTSRLNMGGESNTATYPAPGTPDEVASRRKYPYIASTVYYDSTGNSNYNALLATLNRRTSNGLTYLISYTWSKSIDLACSGNYGVEGCLLQNFYDPRADRSVSGFDLTHIFSANVVYELPFGSGKAFSAHNRAADYLIGGWQVNGITTLTSGTPYSITVNGDLANTGNTFVQANLIGNPTPANRSSAEWINPAAFAAPPAYTFGTFGRNALRSDWYRNVDVSVFRQFPITERIGFEFRAEAFNALNDVVFAAPNAVVNVPAFGAVTSIANVPRELQVALKFRF